MNVFDLNTMKAYPYEERDKNVLYRTLEFKARIIELPPGGTMPECQMESYVVFAVINGEAAVTVDQKEMFVKAGHCLITEPAILSMKTSTGVKILGMQIKKADND